MTIIIQFINYDNEKLKLVKKFQELGIKKITLINNQINTIRPCNIFNKHGIVLDYDKSTIKLNVSFSSI